MRHHRFFDSDSDEEIPVHPLPPPSATAKQPLTAKWPRRFLIR